jgi:hypothetical protein
MIVNDELKNVEGSGHGLIQILSWNLPGETEEDHGNLGQDSNWTPLKYMSEVLPIKATY